MLIRMNLDYCRSALKTNAMIIDQSKVFRPAVFGQETQLGQNGNPYQHIKVNCSICSFGFEIYGRFTIGSRISLYNGINKEDGCPLSVKRKASTAL